MSKMEGNRDVKGLIENFWECDINDKKKIIKSLGNIGSSLSVIELIKILEEDNHTLNGYIMEALGSVGDPHGIDELIGIMMSHNNRWIRWQATNALGDIKDPRAIIPFTKALFYDENVYVRLSTIDGLVSLKDDKAIKPLIFALNDKDEKVVIKAVQALGNMGNEIALKPLKIAYQNGSDILKKNIEASELKITTRLHITDNNLKEIQKSYGQIIENSNNENVVNKDMNFENLDNSMKFPNNKPKMDYKN